MPDYLVSSIVPPLSADKRGQLTAIRKRAHRRVKKMLRKANRKEAK